jgi:hypothetical protein
MAHPLDAARLKVVRAQEHITALKIEIRAYLDKEPYKIEIEKRKDHGTGEMVAVPKIDITIPPPLHLSAVIGDCITNVRASLDYIIWELVVRYFSPPLDVTKSAERRLTYFPISADPLSIMGRLDSLAKRGIPAAAIDEIKAVQPQNRGYEPLRWIDRLVSVDKHRMPLLLLSYVPTVLWISDMQGNVLSIASGKLKTSVVSEGHIKVEMDRQLAVTVTFQDVTMPREPIDRTLEQIVETAAHVVPRFERFF